MKKVPFLPLNQNIYNPGGKNEEKDKVKNEERVEKGNVEQLAKREMEKHKQEIQAHYKEIYMYNKDSNRRTTRINKTQIER